MEKGYVVQGEVYAEPVLEAEVVPIMGEVVGEVVPSATDHLPDALDGAPRLALVAAGSADALRFDHADVLRAGGEAPLTANGKHVGLYWPQPRNAWGHWDYIDLGCSDRVRPLRVKLELPYIIFYSREHGEFAFDVSMWKLHEGRHLVLVKACAGNPGGPTRMSKDACGRDFVLHADGTIGPRTAQHLRLGVFVPKPPAPCGPGWSAHQNIDMCGQGDVEIIHNWRATHSIEDLQRIVEQKGYSAVCVGNFGHAALKQFPYQLTAGHCKPSQGYTNTLYIWSGGGSGSPSKVAPAMYAENGESVSVSASLYSPATSCHLTNDGTLGASAKPAPYTLEFEGPPGDGVKFRLRASDGRYLRSDGREGTPPQWSSVADASTTAWILRAAGDPFSSPVQLKSPGNGGHEPCLCNDQPTGGWGGAVKGKWSWCPEGRGDAYWKLVKMGEVVTAEINLENELTTNQWSAGKPGGGPEAFAANPWRFNADHTFVTERDGCHGTWFVSGDKRSLRMDWQDGQRGNYAEFLRRPGFPPTCDNVGSSYGFMRSWSLTLRGGGNVVPATDTGIGGTYDGDGLRYVITATADPSVVNAKVAGFSFEMRKNSHTAWDGVLPPHMPGLGGAPIHWEFEPGLGAFTSKAPGKPTRRFVRLTSGRSGAAPVTSLDDYVGQRCESFPNGQPGRIVETFQFTREGAIYVTTGTASGRNTYTRHGETLQHQQHAQITATLQPNGELAWSHGYGSRICGRGGGGGGGYEENWARIWCPIAGHPDMDQGAYHEPIGLCNYTTRRYEHDRPDEEIGGNCICLPLVTACWIGTLCYQPCGCICAHQVPWLGDCPCSEQRVTKHFVEKYPHLVTKGPARMER